MKHCSEEAHGKTVSRRTEISYKADHPGVNQHNMTKPCDSGGTVNEAVCRDSLCPYTPQGSTEQSPGRSDRRSDCIDVTEIQFR